MSTSNKHRAIRAWGAHPPAWVIALAEACDATSQSKVADDLEISSAAVNQVLGRAYKGRTDRIESRVRGRYLAETVICPVLGEISSADCTENQKQARVFRSTNPTRVRLFQACPKCPNSESVKEASCSRSSKRS